jgi:integrase
VRLTDITIKALKAPEKGVVYHTDDLLTGFGIRCSEGGTKSYVLTYGPRRTRETIGRVGVIGLKQARQEAKRRLADITLGANKPRSLPWNEALEEYLAHVGKKCRPSTLKSYRRHLEGHFRFGPTKMTALNPEDFQKALRRLEDRPAELHHAFVYLRAFVRWAYRKHYLDKNPIERMEAPPRSRAKDRILTDAELRKVWNAAPDDPFGRIVRLLILCGQRVGETSRIEPGMIAGDTITLPSSITKNGIEHTFPFPRMAKPYLHHLSYQGFSKAKTRLDTASGVYGWTLHDLRRTFASKLGALGVPFHVIEKLLNHVSGSFAGVTGVYQRHDFLPEMRTAVAKWEKRLQQIIKT